MKATSPTNTYGSSRMKTTRYGGKLTKRRRFI